MEMDAADYSKLRQGWQGATVCAVGLLVSGELRGQVQRLRRANWQWLSTARGASLWPAPEPVEWLSALGYCASGRRQRTVDAPHGFGAGAPARRGPKHVWMILCR